MGNRDKILQELEDFICMYTDIDSFYFRMMIKTESGVIEEVLASDIVTFFGMEKYYAAQERKLKESC